MPSVAEWSLIAGYQFTMMVNYFSSIFDGFWFVEEHCSALSFGKRHFSVHQFGYFRF